MHETLTGMRGVRIGVVAGVDERGAPLVRFDDAGDVASAASVWMREPIDWSACTGLRVVVALPEDTRPGGDGGRAIVIGLLDAPPRARVVRVESGSELVLECGKAKLVLRADGRIEILGGYVLSRSTGPNKIKGSSVDIN